jgi:DNA-binding GntR family transcriptional regulator
VTVAERAGGGRKLRRQTVVESATEELRRRILAGEFRENDALRQDALAEEFGISRIPVREAFRQLAAEGLVTIHAHRGAVVSALSPGEIAELFDLRALLEPDLIRRAVPRMGEAELAEAAGILADYSAAIDRADLNAWGELNTEYHLALYRPAGRVQTLALVRTLLANTDRYTRLQLALGGGTERAKAEHAELLEICRRGAAEEAGRFTRRHVLEVKRDLLRLIAASSEAALEVAD